MATTDARRLVREEVEGVLRTFGVPFENVRQNNHDAVQFEIGGRRAVYTIAGGDPRAHLNARSQIRNMLIAAGLTPKVPTKETKVNGSATIDDQPHVQEPLPPIPEPVAAAEEPAPVQDQPEPEPVQPSATLNPDGQYSVVQTKIPGKLIAVELDRDLMALKGSVLVIPLHRPNTVIEMTKEMYESLFETMAVPQEPPSPPVQEPHLEPEREAAPEAEPELEPEVEPEPEPEPEPDEPPVTKFAAGTSGMSPRSHHKKRLGREVNWEDTSYRRGSPRSIDGVSPQMARVLAGILHVTDMSGHTELTPSMLDNALLPHDRRQYSNRVAQLARLGLVDRQPLSDGSGWYGIKITAKGRRALPKLGAWPWLYDGLTVPTWVQGK